jgi:hypothetical protein
MFTSLLLLLLLLLSTVASPVHTQLSAVQFHLITTTILFLSREGFRRGGLRIQEEQQQQATPGSKKVCMGGTRGA